MIFNYDFLKFWTGQTVSIFGTLIGKIALPFLIIYTLNATPAQIAAVRVSELVPGMAAGLLAGVIVDRLRRRPIMIWADICRACMIGSIPLAAIYYHLSLTHIILVAAIVSILTVFFDVSYEAYIPTLVDDSKIVDANSKISASASVAEVSGFGIAGLLFQWLGGAMTLAVDSISFLVSAITLLWIRKKEPPLLQIAKYEGTIIKEAAAGLKVIVADRNLLVLSGIDSLGSLFNGIMSTIYVLYISRVLQIEPGVQGVLYAIGGISSFIGAAYAKPIATRMGLSKTLVLTAFLGLAGYALVPLASGSYAVVLGCLIGQQFLGDGADTIYNIHITSFRQVVVENRVLGRVNASWRVFNGLFMLLGTGLAGLFANDLGLRTIFFLALACRLISTLWLFFFPISHMQSPVCEVDVEK